MSRYGRSIINRDNYEYGQDSKDSTPSWAADYERVLTQKEAVKSRREDDGLFNQINRIINNTHSKFSNVEDAVQDLTQRTGLTEFLARQKRASLEIFQQVPQLKTFIENYVELHPGSSVEAVVQAALKFPDISAALPSVNDLDDEVKKYINQQLGENKLQKNPGENHQLGKQDLNIDNNLMTENNPFNGLLPKGQ